MEGHLLMSAKERIRKTVFEEVKAGRMTRKEAARRLGLGYRQCRRSYKRFCEQGDAGLVHRSRGRPSNRRLAEGFRKKVIRRYRERYMDFGPTLAAEKLAEEAVVLDHETLRRLLVAEGLWAKQRKRRKYRQRRKPKAHFGELVQMDGSHHRWFGDQRAQCCLMNMVDDATGHTLSLMADQETTKAAMGLLRAWCERYGIPKALYTDKKTVFVTAREPTLEEQLAGEEPKTAFGKACAKLDIEIITAHSPQAKGRVERNHGVYQDRFVKELALRRITTIDGANKALHNGFIDKLNANFARRPASHVDFHRPLPKDLDLADVFCFEERRTVQNDWTIRYDNRHYQLDKDNKPLPKPKDKVLVRIRLDGAMSILYRDKPLQFRTLSNHELEARLANKKPPAAVEPPKESSRPSEPTKSPWRQNCILMAADTPERPR